jgi:hypothetical protein
MRRFNTGFLNRVRPSYLVQCLFNRLHSLHAVQSFNAVRIASICRWMKPRRYGVISVSLRLGCCRFR